MGKKRFELLTDAQWELIEPLLLEPKRRKDKRGRPWGPTARAWKAFYGHCRPARRGEFCPTNIRRRPPAGGD